MRRVRQATCSPVASDRTWRAVRCPTNSSWSAPPTGLGDTAATAALNASGSSSNQTTAAHDSRTSDAAASRSKGNTRMVLRVAHRTQPGAGAERAWRSPTNDECHCGPHASPGRRSQDHATEYPLQRGPNPPENCIPPICEDNHAPRIMHRAGVPRAKACLRHPLPGSATAAPPRPGCPGRARCSAFGPCLGPH